MQKKSHDGQAILEFILLVMITASTGLLLQQQFRKTVRKLWIFYIQQISAPCLGCRSDPQWR